MSYTEKLKEALAAKESGEDYIECPRCEGTMYESAIPLSKIDDYRPMAEEYPCPLCVASTLDIDIDKAIDWLRDKAEYEEDYREGDYEDNEDNEDNEE